MLALATRATSKKRTLKMLNQTTSETPESIEPLYERIARESKKFIFINNCFLLFKQNSKFKFKFLDKKHHTNLTSLVWTAV